VAAKTETPHSVIKSKPALELTVSGRELRASRTFDAPPELIFKVWTDPEHIARWYDPTGFRTTTHSMDLRVGGVWRYTMHGPDGRDYENIMSFLEVDRPRKLVYKHGDAAGTEPVGHMTTATFEPEAGGTKTRVTMTLVFDSEESLQHVVKTYGALEGAKQHMARLEEYLGTLDGGANPDEFVISRVFNAPRELVYKAWTEKERLMEWFGPKGVTMSKATMDLRPGGVFHYCMKTPDGREMWGKWVFREVVPGERLVLVSSFSDEKGGLTRHPMAPQWPLETLSSTTFEPHAGIGGGTVLTIRWSPLNATEAERAAFRAGFNGMNKGWGGTFEQLEAYLSSAQSA
jgi:uncharacterized protein YndB with AHSA1/START domain